MALTRHEADCLSEKMILLETNFSANSGTRCWSDIMPPVKGRKCKD